MRRSETASWLYDTYARGGMFGRVAVAVLLLAFAGNLLFVHEASATFFAMRGRTQIHGTDALTGRSYTADSGTRQLYVYPGSTVGFRASAWNGGNHGRTTDVSVHSLYFDGSTSNGSTERPFALTPQRVTYPGVNALLWPISEAAMVAGAALNYNFHDYSPVNRWVTPSVAVNSALKDGYDIPGKKYCQYVHVSVAGYNVIPWFGSYVTSRNSDGSFNGALLSNVGPQSFKPNNWAGFGVVVPSDAMACAEVAYNYNLLPKITASTSAAGSSTVNISTSIEQDPTWYSGQDPGSITRSQPAQWQISRFYSQTSSHNTGAAPSTNDPCAYINGALGGAITGCSSAANGNNAVFGKTGQYDASLGGDAIRGSVAAPTWNSGSIDRTQYPYVCYILSVNSYRPKYNIDATWTPASPYVQNNTWNNSAVNCSSTAGDPKKPQVQVMGDDIRVGGQIFTLQSPHTVDGLASLFGSWGQYATYSVGKVTGFATQAALKDGIPDPVSQPLPPSAYSALTFANAAGAYGEFSESMVNSVGSTEVKKFFEPLAKVSPQTLPATDLSDVTHSKKPYLVTGTLDVTASTEIPASTTIIIVATDKVTIRSNIHYTQGVLRSVGEIPQVVIVAPNISIAEGVSNVDAWLVADSVNGTVDTCDPRSLPATDARLTDRICADPLTVNGPVVAKTLKLNRTYGAKSGDENKSAERFNNRGDSYLWAMNYMRDQSQQGLVTTNRTELPPRY